MADVFNAEVVTLKVGEGAAYGAALQALWSWQRQSGEDVSINDLTDRFVTLNGNQRATPNAAAVETYRNLQALQDSASTALRKVFGQHRAIVS